MVYEPFFTFYSGIRGWMKKFLIVYFVLRSVLDCQTEVCAGEHRNDSRREYEVQRMSIESVSCGDPGRNLPTIMVGSE